MNITAITPAKLDGPAALVAQLRALADELEASGTARTALVVVDNVQSTDVRCLGYRPRRSDTLGLYAFAMHATMELPHG